MHRRHIDHADRIVAHLRDDHLKYSRMRYHLHAGFIPATASTIDHMLSLMMRLLDKFEPLIEQYDQEAVEKEADKISEEIEAREAMRAVKFPSETEIIAGMEKVLDPKDPDIQYQEAIRLARRSGLLQVGSEPQYIAPDPPDPRNECAQYQ